MNDDFINHFKLTTNIFADPSDNDLKDFLNIADTDETNETQPQNIEDEDIEI